MREGVSCDVHRWAGRDGGCRAHARIIGQTFLKKASHLLLVFDYHGCNPENSSIQEIEVEVNTALVQAGWASSDVGVVIFAPELEAWIWSSSPHVATILGWQSQDELRQWLQDPKRHPSNDHIIPLTAPLWPPDKDKPDDPKEAYLLAIREKKVSISASNFRRLADTVSVRKCRDRAFGQFVQLMSAWFPPPVRLAAAVGDE